MENMKTPKNYDVIIIGAGLGGLTAGAMLARYGKKVLVLEQHTAPGGCATTFRRKGVTYEVGLHEMDWGTPDSDMKDLIFGKLGILDKLPLIRLPQAWSVKTDTASYTVPEGRQRVIEYMGNYFPDEKKNMVKYMRELKRSALVASRLPGDLSLGQLLLFPFTRLPVMFRDMLLEEHVGPKLDSLLRTNRLKNILNANLPYYSDDTSDLSWSYYACAQYGYFNSAVFVKGGSQVLSNTLAGIIRNGGGKVRTSCEVKRIVLEGKKVKGVTYLDKRSQKECGVSASIVIANIDPANIFDGRMVSAGLKEPGVENLQPGSSLYTVYITFRTPPSGRYQLSYSNFIYTDRLLDMPPSDLYSYLKWLPVEERPFVFVDYSTIDSGLTAPEDKRSFAVLTGVSQLDEWEGLSDVDYRSAKEKLARSLLDRLEKHYPGITSMVERYEVSTPKTAKRFLRTRNGTAYGYRNTGYVLSGRLPTKSKTVKGLYYAGAWTSPGGGFTGSIISGYMAAEKILHPFFKRIFLKILRLVAYAFACWTAYHIVFPTGS